MPSRFFLQKLLAMLAAISFCFASVAQVNLAGNTFCKDSNTVIRYHNSEAFERSRIMPLADGGTISWGGMLDDYSSFNDLSILRTDAKGAILWSTKLLPEINLNFPPGVEVVELNSGGIIVTGTAKFGHDNYPQYFFIASINNAGVLLWYHFYELAMKGSIGSGEPYTYKPTIDSQDNIYFPFIVGNVFSDKSGPFGVCKFNSNGSLAWNKAFVLPHDNTPNIKMSAYLNNVFLSNDTLTLFGGTTGQASYLIMQIKSEDASLVGIKAFKPTNFTAFTSYPSGGIAEKTSDNKYVVNSYGGGGFALFGGVDFSTVVFNQKLEPVKIFQVKTFSDLSAAGWGGVYKSVSVSSKGEIMYCAPRSTEKSFYYASLDTSYKISTQKKIQYANNNDGNFDLPPSIFVEGNKLSIRANVCSAFGNTCGIDYLSFDKNISNISSCFKTMDTSFVQLLPFNLLPVPFNWDYTEDNVLNEIPLGLTQQNTIFTAQEICKEISICETPVIYGKDSVCLGSIGNIFTVHTGAQCLEKIKWRTDTSAVSNFKMIDDTTVSIAFKKNWRGYVYATLSGACGDMSDSFFVTAYKNISRKILGSDTSICAGDTAFLKAEPGFANYKWSNGETTNSIAVTTKGNYSIQAFNSDGCYVADTLQILAVYAKPKVEFGVNDFICKGSNEVLDAGDGFINYLWQNGGTERYFTVRMPGQYWVGVKDANGCKGGDTAVITKIYNAPANFLSSDTSICAYETIELKPSNNYLSYLWSNGTVAPSLAINTIGTYWLKVIDGNGCTGVDSMLVTEKFCVNRIIFSNAFSPDKNGINDIFKPFVIGGLLKYKLDIFNRWGKKVFESNDPVKGWDGSNKGILQVSTAYVWICNYQFAGEQPKTQKGNLLLIR